MIEVRKLVKRFGLKTVLRGLDFQVEPGEFVALLGPNGAGKTTFLRILASLSRPSLGEVRIAGYRLPGQAARRAAAPGRGFAPAPAVRRPDRRRKPALLRADVRRRLPWSSASAEVLELVGLAPRRRDLVRTFSRGMQQRLAIGRAVLHDPEVMLFDEPHTGLDQDACAMLDDGAARGGCRRAHGGDDLARPGARRGPGLALRCALSRGVIAASIQRSEIDPDDLLAFYRQATSAS